MPREFSEPELVKRLIVPPGRKIKLSRDFPTSSKEGRKFDKRHAAERLREGIRLLSELQSKLYAQNRYALLISLQAMDAAGKDGTIKHVMSGINPQGCRVTSFKAPSSEERTTTISGATPRSCRNAATSGFSIARTTKRGGQTGSWQPWVAMGSAKAAKEALARYFAVALAQKGITVNIISPGACDDSVLSGLPPQVFQMIKDWHESGWTPMRRLGLPADVGNAVVLLCTDQASFITGQLLYVDGGASAMEPVFPLAIQGIK